MSPVDRYMTAASSAAACQNHLAGVPTHVAVTLLSRGKVSSKAGVMVQRPIALPDGSVFHSDPDTMGGTPVFVGTRVPVRSLIDYLEGGYSLDQFLDAFPTVRREQVVAFLEQAARALLEDVA